MFRVLNRRTELCIRKWVEKAPAVVNLLNRFEVLVRVENISQLLLIKIDSCLRGYIISVEGLFASRKIIQGFLQNPKIDVEFLQRGSYFFSGLLINNIRVDIK